MQERGTRYDHAFTASGDGWRIIDECSEVVTADFYLQSATGRAKFYFHL
jgi:hypothetical protein